MNNSDIIAALSLAITAIIFLVQTDDGLLKLKIRKYERWWIGGILLTITLLVNHNIFERFGVTFYFSLWNKYLLPSEWALILFLVFLGITLHRIFSPRIFNTDSKTILALVDKYRQEKKWSKLQNLLLQVIDLDTFEELYAERLNDTIFNDHHLIEHFASNFPELLIKFSNKYRAASINHGEHFFYILNGLFADKSNPIFSEIRHYHNDLVKNIFLDDHWNIKYNQPFTFNPKENYRTILPIISWLTSILNSFPTDFKDETNYFLRQYPDTSASKNNKVLYSAEQIERLLSRDTVFNSIKLFRILLVEFSLNNKKALQLIDRPLLMFYSSWNFIQDSTSLETGESVALNNDSYTVNEYFLKYLFHGYLSIFLLMQFIRPHRNKNVDDKNDVGTWPLKQLFAKLDSLIGHKNIVSDKSKRYYLEALFSLYFEMPEYFSDNTEAAGETSEILLWYIKDSLKGSPYGDVKLFHSTFYEVCSTYDFIEHDSKIEHQKRKHFYQYLLPYTSDYKWRITDSL